MSKRPIVYAKPLSRRELGFGMAALFAAPYLGLLRGAKAQSSGGRAKRLVIFFSPNGTDLSRWRPVNQTALSFRAGDILEPLSSVKQHLLVLDGLNFVKANNHAPGMHTMLTDHQATSVDQHVAANLGTNRRLRSLELGVQTSAWGEQEQTRMIYRNNGFVPPDDNPKGVYTRLFGSAPVAPSPTPGGPTPPVDMTIARHKSALDRAMGDFARLRACLGGAERQRLEATLQSFRETEQRLFPETTSSGGSTGGGVPTEPAPTVGECPPAAVTFTGPGSSAQFPTAAGAQIDLAVAALACGQTDVVSLQMSHTVSPLVMSWIGVGEEHHSLSHSKSAGFITAERWFAGQFASLVSKLAALPEPNGDGSMLDHSVVVWSKELADGSLHDSISVPFILAGKAGGYLTPGRYLKLGGITHARLLHTISDAMGVGQSPYSTSVISEVR